MSEPFLIIGKGDYQQWPMTLNFNCHLLTSFELKQLSFCGVKDVNCIFVDFNQQNKMDRKIHIDLQVYLSTIDDRYWPRGFISVHFRIYPHTPAHLGFKLQ